MKIDKIILCGNNGNNAVFFELSVPGKFTGDINFTFGSGGFCGAWRYDKKPFEIKENGVNGKKVLDISKNSVTIANNSFV